MFKTIYSHKIRQAINFAITTHEVDQKQHRKGKDVAFITHPLIVATILSRAGASEDAIVAGILHDTIEDSIPEKKVTAQMISEKFGDNVAKLVLSVTEEDRNLSWEKRKEEAVKHIRDFSPESLLVKSADVISNTSEIIDDHAVMGDEVFERFNAGKEKILRHYLELIRTIIECWPENPMAQEMSFIAYNLQRIGQDIFMVNNPARIIEYSEFDVNEVRECPACHWQGTAIGNQEFYDDLLEVVCPICEKKLLVVNYPLIKK